VNAPFRRLPFRTLPEKPRRPHSFLDLPLARVRVDLGGERLEMAYRVAGEGPALLVLHGLMTTSYSWRYVMPGLAARYTVYAPDLPGAGASEAPRRCDAETLTRSIAAFQEAVGIGGCAVIGNSMAGYLAMRLALDEPATMSCLVNVHSPGIPTPRFSALRAALSIPGARAALGFVVSRAPERWVHANVHYHDETLKSREEARVYAEPLESAVGRAAFASWLGDGLDPRPMRELVAKLEATEGFPVPLQLLYARADPMVPPRVGEALHALVPDAEMVWVDGTSHFMHVDTPEAFLEAALPFLDRVGK